MTSPPLLVSLIAAALVLAVVVRGLSRRRLPPSRLALMALVWAAVIAGLALILTRTGIH